MATVITLNGVTKDIEANDVVISGIRRVASTGRLVIEDTANVKPNLCLNSNKEDSTSRYIGIAIPSSALKPNTTYTWSAHVKWVDKAGD